MRSRQLPRLPHPLPQVILSFHHFSVLYPKGSLHGKYRPRGSIFNCRLDRLNSALPALLLRHNMIPSDHRRPCNFTAELFSMPTPPVTRTSIIPFDGLCCPFLQGRQTRFFSPSPAGRDLGGNYGCTALPRAINLEINFLHDPEMHEGLTYPGRPRCCIVFP